MKDKIDISLVTGTLGRKETLKRLLASLRSQTQKNFEFILVDQNEPGYLDDVVAEYGDLNLIHATSPRGLSVARNIGLKFCRGEIVGFPDDDCWYNPDLLHKVTSKFRLDRDLGMLLGKTVDKFGKDSLGVYHSRAQALNRSNVWTNGNSNGLFVLAQVANAVNGFDVELGVGSSTIYQSGEETDFMLRCLDWGAKSLYDPEIMVRHDQVERLSDKDKIDRIRRYSPGYGRVLRKNGYGVTTVLNKAARSTVSGLLSSVCGQRAQGNQKLAWAMGAVRGYFKKQ